MQAAEGSTIQDIQAKLVPYGFYESTNSQALSSADRRAQPALLGSAASGAAWGFLSAPPSPIHGVPMRTCWLLHMRLYICS